MLRSFDVLCLAGTHILSWLLWCSLGVYGSSRGGPIDRVGLSGCVCRTFRSYLAKYRMDVSYGDGPLQTYVDDYRRMRSSNDCSLDRPVDLSSLGVVDLDTSIVLDVFGLWAFDSRELVTCVWPSALFEAMHRRQVDMEYLRRACRRQYDS